MQQAIIPGTVIDNRYQIQKKIPDTTSNQCYLAEDIDQSNRLVMISFPRMELQTLPGFSAGFEEACERLMKARLSGLIKTLDHGTYNSRPYAILQYVTHESLESVLTASRVREKKLSVDEVLNWARPLAVTLDELHQVGYVHSNVRPSTVLLGENRQILLGDFISEFTIQRLSASKQAITALDIGDHLAPEYIKSHYTESYDQYLLATIIYKALASRSHFHNPGSTEAYRRQVATKFPEPLLNHRPELVGASRILGKALERNPVKRFDSCRDFVNQLESAQINPTFVGDKSVKVIKKVLDLDETASAEPIFTSIRSNRARSRKKGFAWLGILLLGVCVSAYAVNHFDGVELFKVRFNTAWSDLTQDPAQALIVAPIDISKQGQQLAVVQYKADISEEKEVLGAVAVASEKVVNALPASSGSRADITHTQGDSNNSEVSDVAKTSSDITSSKVSVVAMITENVIEITNVASGDALKIVVDQALVEGQEAFAASSNADKMEATPDNVNDSAMKIDEAVSAALQEAQADFMQQTSPATSTATEKGETPLADGDLSGSVDEETIDNKRLSDTELQSLDLNSQIIAVNQLADRQTAVAKLAAENKKRERVVQQKAKLQQPQANVSTVSAEKDKSFAAMQKERARIQSLKVRKIARIKRVTKDCVASGKIYRQVVAGNLSYVKNCLAVGIDPNLDQNNRKSLLHLASQGGYLNMAKLLLAKGANVNAKSSDGKTPLDTATEKKQDRLINYLRSHGGLTSR